MKILKKLLEICLIIILLVLFTFTAYNLTKPSKKEISVYTNKDIYHINIDTYTVYSESGELKKISFKTFKELQEYVEEITYKDIN